jgi:hypothetical protein
MQLLPGTGYQRAGKTSRILIGSSALAYASWEVSEKTTALDTMNFESYNVIAAESFGEGLHDGVECELRGAGDWDAHNAAYGAVPGLYIRDDLVNSLYYTSRIDGVFWSFPYSRISSSTNGATAKGVVTFSYSGMSQGPFTPPTVSV